MTKWCNDCRACHKAGHHLPLWDVWCNEHGDERGDYRPVRASDAEEAAKRWASMTDYESADYTIVSGEEETVFVAPHDDETTPPKKYLVTGESIPQYYAREITDDSLLV